MTTSGNFKGISMAIGIILLWTFSLLYALHWKISWNDWKLYFLVAILTFLYSGLFITAHESWHHSVSKNRKINEAVGIVCCTLFVYNSYYKIRTGHHQHHAHPGDLTKDPETAKNQSYWPWFFRFVWNYSSISQFMMVGATVFLLSYLFPVWNVLVFYILPAVLATHQLFYFGTYLPHRGGHKNKHNSSSQKHNHFLAFISCYFFGYHFEHHNSPGTPWYELPLLKERYEKEGRNIPEF